jgi:CRP-like cAMP-binding protein
VLSENELARHGRSLTQATLTHGQKLFVSCEPLSHVYFPITCVASRLHAAQCGHFAEMGMVGFEGVVGLSVFLGAKAAANNAVVHIEGIALRMEAAAAKAMFQQHPPFRAALLRYMRAMISQISLLAVCNSLHPIEQRLCRWLLLTDERASTDDLRITHDFIAQMLSVRRESVTTALRHLSQAGLIYNGRCSIHIVDRSGLEAASCECYSLIRDAYANLREL